MFPLSQTVDRETGQEVKRGDVTAAEGPDAAAQTLKLSSHRRLVFVVFVSTLGCWLPAVSLTIATHVGPDCYLSSDWALSEVTPPLQVWGGRSLLCLLVAGSIGLSDMKMIITMPDNVLPAVSAF